MPHRGPPGPDPDSGSQGSVFVGATRDDAGMVAVGGVREGRCRSSRPGSGPCWTGTSTRRWRRCGPTGAPRISGAEIQFAGRDVFTGSMPGAVKGADLRRDPRVAFHSQSEDADESDPESWPGDAKFPGRAVLVTDPDEHAAFWAAYGGPEPPGGPDASDLFRIERVRGRAGDDRAAAHGDRVLARGRRLPAPRPDLSAPSDRGARASRSVRPVRAIAGQSVRASSSTGAVRADRQGRIFRRRHPEPLGQRDRVERRPHLDVVVEVDEDVPGLPRRGGASTCRRWASAAAQVRIRAAQVERGGRSR